MNRTHSTLFVLLSLLLLLGGCIAAPAPSASTPGEADSAESELAETTQTCDPGFVLYEHEFLVTQPICIPTEPERIVALNENTMANLLALGVTPVGVVDHANRDFTRYLGDTTEEIPSVGATDGPNIESILAQNPDLILGLNVDLEEDMLENLQSLVPVALSQTPSNDWVGHFLFVGEAVQRGAEAQTLVDETNRRLAAFRTAYEAQAEDETIAIIRSRADSFNIYNKESFIAELSEDAGLRMPPAFDELDAWNSMSLEAIPMLNSDKLFVMVRNEREMGAFANLLDSPLWQTLPAVQNDAVHVVNWSVWVAGWNIVGTNLVIDDFFFYILNAEPPIPNPFDDLIIDTFGPQSDLERFN